MLAFAERLTRVPWDMGQADVEELREHGFDDRDIHDITQIAAYFNYINRVADALGVDDEAWFEMGREEWLARKGRDYGSGS